jgi:membrane protein
MWARRSGYPRPVTTASQPAGPAGQRAAPDRPGGISREQWLATAKRAVAEFREDNLTDCAAALTYYAVLALFPALIVVVAIVGLAGQYPRTTNALTDIIAQAGAPKAADTARGTIEDIVRHKGGAGALLGIGLVGAIWSASGYMGAFMRASNAVYEVEEGRPFWKLRPLQIAVTMLMLALLALVAIGLVVSGALADAIGNEIGLGHTAVVVWGVAKWPAMLLIVMVSFSLLYWIAPNVRPPRFRWLTPGGAIAVLAWIAASVGFAFYVKNFGSYNQTYGALAGAVIFLLWLWISNVALLFGAEFNAELERTRELAAGEPAEERILLPPREAKR